ncbi:MAG TPA: gliding motility lipoprotein GldH [Prolixibacteraceae bacterium]|nr:gliding motility lipoprotein GldH [Prolixibacteraceae bacterium]
MKYFLVGVLFMLITTGCDKNRVYEQYLSVDSAGWHKDSLLVFDFEIDNSNQAYNLLLNVRNIEAYSYSNLWLFADIIAPDSTSVRDTLEYTLAYPNGKWTGQGASGVYNNSFVFRSNVFFPVQGNYRFVIQQAMRNDMLKGITNIGLRIEKKQ